MNVLLNHSGNPTTRPRANSTNPHIGQTVETQTVSLFVTQVRIRAGTRAMETTGTRDMVTRAMATVDTAAMATMTTILVTMGMAVPDMITVSMRRQTVICLCPFPICRQLFPLFTLHH